MGLVFSALGVVDLCSELVLVDERFNFFKDSAGSNHVLLSLLSRVVRLSALGMKTLSSLSSSSLIFSNSIDPVEVLLFSVDLKN